MSPTPTFANLPEAPAAAIASYMATAMSAPPPPGQFVNTIDPPTRQPAIIGVCVIMYLLTTVAVGLRLWSSFLVTKAHGWEDYTAIIATGLSFAYMGFVLNLSNVALHMWDVPVRWFSEHYWKLRYAQNNIVAFAFFASRLPILLLYLRVFSRNKSFRYLCYFGFFADFIVYLCNVPLLAIFCAPPLGASWASIFEKCKRLEPLAIAQGSCNVALDIFILALPVRPIINLQLPRRKKIGVLIVFGTGLFALISSVISLYYRYELTYRPDTNWNEGAFVASAAVEINVAIICSSMPGCASLARHIFEGKTFLGSSLVKYIRFGRSLGIDSSSDASQKQPKPAVFRYSGPYGFSSSDNASTDSTKRIATHNYIELHGTAHDQIPPQANARTDIRRTVEIEVV